MFYQNAHRERGQGLVEYAMLLALVALVAIIGLAAFGESLYGSYRCLAITMENLGGSPISGFMLVDSGADSDIQWVCGQNLALADMPGNVSFRTYGPEVGSMRLSLSGPVSNTRVENVTPYSLWGDNAGDFAGQSLATGEYTLTATAYSGSGGGGSELGSLTIDFVIQ